MKILLIDNSHLPNIGGKEIVVHHLARQYQNLGHEVLVAGAGGFGKHRNLDFGYPVQRFSKLPLLSIDLQWPLRIRRMAQIFPFDLVHSHTTHPTGYFAAKFLRRSSKTQPLIITPHGADIHKVPEVNFGKRLDPILDEKIRWTLNNCAYSTAISESVRSSLLDAGMSDDRIISISNGVDAGRLGTPSGQDAREFLKLPPNTPYFVSTGNYHPRKGHETLVEAVAGCKDPRIHVVIIGRTSKEFVNSVKSGPVKDRVTFTGPLNFPILGLTQGPDTIASLLQQSTGYISASVGEGTEGLSLALLEAMASGTGIIATNVSGNKDMIRNRENGLLIKPASSSELAQAMDLLTADPSLRNAISENAKTAIAKYSWEAIARQYISLFERAIAETSRSTG